MWQLFCIFPLKFRDYYNGTQTVDLAVPQGTYVCATMKKHLTLGRQIHLILMNRKKENLHLLFIHIFIGLIAAVVTAWALYQNKLEFWQMQARSAFRAALMEELQKNDTTDVYYSMSGNRRLSNDPIDIPQEPIKVTMKSELGQKDFWIPYEKHIHNIEQPSDRRGIRSYLLHLYPLNADSLNTSWKNRLTGIGFSGTTATRISVTDWWEQDSFTYSGDSLYPAKSDSLITYYLGYRCEVGATGYLYNPWWVALSWKDMGLSAALIALCILLFFMQGYVNKVYLRFFAKRKPIVIEKEVPVIIEKEVPVAVGCEHHLPIYRLEEGVYYDADARMLKKGDKTLKLMPLSAKLLQGFLEAADDYRLSNDEILHLLWPDGSGTLDRLHQNIKRLRDCLSRISSCTIENENSAYRLKTPIPSRKIPSE